MTVAIGSSHDPTVLYRTLGVPPSASPAEVRQAFRTLARRYHPDSAGQASPVALGSVVSAYRTLERLGALDEPAQPAAPLRHVDVYA